MAIILVWCARGMISLDKHLFDKLSVALFSKTSLEHLRFKHPATAIFLLIMVINTGWFIRKDIKTLDCYPNEHRIMGHWVRDNLPKDSVIMATSPHVSFYSGTRLFITPWATIPEILRYGRYHRVGYLIVDEAFTPEMRPLIAELLHEDGSPEGLKLIHKIVGANGRKVLAYQLVKG